MDMDIRQQIKEILLKENIGMTDLVSKLNENRPDNEKTTASSLGNKLTRGTIKYSEVIDIAKILGYEISWNKVEAFQYAFKFGNFKLGRGLSSIKQETDIKKRLSFEISVSYDISKFIYNLIDYFVNTFVIEDRIAKIFNNYYKEDDFMAINSKLDRYYLPLVYLLCEHSMGDVSKFLTKIKHIYKNGGLETLSDNELHELLENLTTYIEVGFDTL